MDGFFNNANRNVRFSAGCQPAPPARRPVQARFLAHCFGGGCTRYRCHPCKCHQCRSRGQPATAIGRFRRGSQHRRRSNEVQDGPWRPPGFQLAGLGLAIPARADAHPVAFAAGVRG
jgi:hypothetical protein